MTQILKQFSTEKQDEAYSFDSYTPLDHRGKGIAPFLRYALYKELARLGRMKFYSILKDFLFNKSDQLLGVQFDELLGEH